jgi:putative ABC transport system permease protein
VLRAALRDLQWRKKRFIIAMLGVALVFAMGLIMTGLAESFSREVDRTLDAIDAGAWAVAADAGGPFTSFVPIPIGINSEPGASPLMVLRQTVSENGVVDDVILIGVEPGRLGSPRARDGEDLRGPGEAVVDTAFVVSGIGETFAVGSRSFTVVGTVSGRRLYAGLPIVFIPLVDAQALAVQGQSLATAFVYPSRPANLPAGLRIRSNSEVKSDVLRPLNDAVASISFVRVLLWIVAATIIGSVLYLQAVERTRDFAVFKATGTSTAAIGAGLALQAVVLSLAAAVLAALLAVVLAPMFPMDVEIPTSAFVLLPVVTVVVGLLASLIALRRTARVQPALAFGG